MAKNIKPKEEQVNIAFFVPLMFVLAVVPLITVIHQYDCGLEKYNWFSSTGNAYDFFLYYKSRVIMILGLISAGIIGYLLLANKKGMYMKAWVPLVPAGIFAFFSLASALFSEHTDDAFWGGYEQFEGVLVILSYVVCFALAYGYVQKENIIELLLYSLIIGAFIVGLLGFFQALKLDWIKSGWAKTLLTPELSNLPSNFQIKLNFEPGMAYATLYNPNYVGSYVAAALPVTAMLTIWAKDIIFKILAGIASVFQLVMLYASGSFTGYIGVAGAVLVLVVFLVPQAKKYPVRAIGVVLSVVALAAGVLIIKPDILKRAMESTTQKSAYTVQSIKTKDDSFTIQLVTGKTIKGTVTPSTGVQSLTLADGKGAALKCAGDIYKGQTITDSGYENIKFTVGNLNLGTKEKPSILGAIKISADNKDWNLVIADGKLRYYNSLGRFDKLRTVPSIGFENNYDFATKRGYIWSRTFPLLTDSLFIGVGADNFAYAFPNDDYVGKVNCDFSGQIITKPHNMYLQIWVQDGMFACLALIALYIVFAIDTIRTSYFKKRFWISKVGIAIFCAASAYMLAGLANDSTISVAPLFWTLLGLGFAANRMARKQTEQEAETEK